MADDLRTGGFCGLCGRWQERPGQPCGQCGAVTVADVTPRAAVWLKARAAAITDFEREWRALSDAERKAKRCKVRDDLREPERN
jgi:hypothetical protein